MPSLFFECVWHDSRYGEGVKAIATWIRECDEASFHRMLQSYGDIQTWNARTQTVPSEVAGLLLTGGSDISRAFLRQPVPDPSLIQDADPARDEWDFAALQSALKARLPIFAVCRGLQILNVALGGTLRLDIPNHDDNKYDNVQALRYAPDAAIQIPQVNSSHHQAIDRLGKGLRVEAWCQADDVIEQARLVDYPYCRGVQYHPERDEIYRPLFDSFAEQVMREPAWV